jgi:serpin B
MTDEAVFVQDVLHAVRIQVNEKGTKAAAATAAVIATRGSRPTRKDPVVMTVSSPFVFVVAHPATKTLLFAAVVSNPVA